ncbi:hypothetical protein OBBRIDRAFT_838184 [Obba rivulosa]|uniref:Uncharacterized protein n=1 Tax=Obba rivulosa TaxID=1052685 RepID=A0A8E2ALK4_9APHY|nr:hypothetical protein OBBRIDRAFT_838184 [Obba rivulosa]
MVTINTSMQRQTPGKSGTQLIENIEEGIKISPYITQAELKHCVFTTLYPRWKNAFYDYPLAISNVEMRTHEMRVLDHEAPTEQVLIAEFMDNKAAGVKGKDSGEVKLNLRKNIKIRLVVPRIILEKAYEHHEIIEDHGAGSEHHLDYKGASLEHQVDYVEDHGASSEHHLDYKGVSLEHQVDYDAPSFGRYQGSEELHSRRSMSIGHKRSRVDSPEPAQTQPTKIAHVDAQHSKTTRLETQSVKTTHSKVSAVQNPDGGTKSMQTTHDHRSTTEMEPLGFLTYAEPSPTIPSAELLKKKTVVSAEHAACTQSVQSDRPTSEAMLTPLENRSMRQAMDRRRAANIQVQAKSLSPDIRKK